MTVSATYSLFCQGVRSSGIKCHVWIGQFPEQPEVRQVARHYGRVHGWERKLINGKYLDLCPICVAGLKQQRK